MPEAINNPDDSDLKDCNMEIEYQYLSEEYYYYQNVRGINDARHAYLFEVDWQQIEYYNLGELDVKAQNLANAKFANMPSTIEAAEYTFAGIWQLLPDGIVTQIVWQVSESGEPTTRVLYNDSVNGFEGRPGVGESIKNKKWKPVDNTKTNLYL